MKNSLHTHDIYPKVVPAGKETEITIKPLGYHADYRGEIPLTIRVCPFDEGDSHCYPDRPNNILIQPDVHDDGRLTFKFKFFGEQQYYIRIMRNNDQLVQLSLFSVGEDLVGRYPLKGDLHMHSRRSDGQQAPEIVAAYYRKTGYDFLAITDHRRYYPALDAIEAYKDVPIEFLLVPGEEVHSPSNDNDHINDVHNVSFGADYSINALYGGNDGSPCRAIIDNPPPIMSKEEFHKAVDDFAETIEIPAGVEKYAYACNVWLYNEIRKANGLAIFCHPYWLSNVLQVPPSFVDALMENHPFDAFEVLGGESNFEQNGFQTVQYYEDRAKGRDYPIVGSTDSHSAYNNRNSRVCSTIVFSPKNERRDIIESIRAKYSVAVDTISTEPRFVGELRLVRYACFLDQEFFPLHDDLCYEEGRAMKDYVTGVEGAKETLEFISGRVAKQRAKYFAW